MRNRVLHQALRSIADPGSIALLAVLLINDHVLRVHWPSWWTGKLGDVAWLGFAPLALAVPLAFLMPRSMQKQGRAVGLTAVILVGGVFAMANTLPAAHAVTIQLFKVVFGWTPGLKRDPTDLLTLPALYFAYSVWVRNRHPAARQRVIRGLTMLSLACFATVANTPKPRCDDLIENPEMIQEAVSGHPFIVALSDEFAPHNVRVDECFVDGATEVRPGFDVPAYYSQYGIPYSTDLAMTYFEDGSMELVWDWDYPDWARTPEGLIRGIKQAIDGVERDEQFEEFVRNVGSMETSEPSMRGRAYADRVELLSSSQGGPSEWFGGPAMSFNLDLETFKWVLRSYEVPTALTWETFPELVLAKELAAERLLESEFAGCSLEANDERNPTYMTGSRSGEKDPWHFEFEVDCEAYRRKIYIDMDE